MFLSFCLSRSYYYPRLSRICKHTKDTIRCRYNIYQALFTIPVAFLIKDIGAQNRNQYHNHKHCQKHIEEIVNRNKCAYQNYQTADYPELSCQTVCLVPVFLVIQCPDYLYSYRIVLFAFGQEVRYASLRRTFPDNAEALFSEGARLAKERYEKLAKEGNRE